MIPFSMLSLYCGCVNCGILRGLFDWIMVKIEKKMLLISYDDNCLGWFDRIMVKIREDILEMMMERSLDFLFGKTCLNMAGNYC